MNILLIAFGYTHNNMSSGAHQRTFYLKSALDKIGDVYVLSPVFSKEKECVLGGRIAYCMMERRFSPLYILNKFIGKYFGSTRLHPRGAKKYVDKVFPGVKFDAVVTRFSTAASYTHPWNIARVYHDSDDVPTEVFNTSRRKRWRMLGFIGASISQRYQRWLYGKMEDVFIANKDMADRIPNSIWLPNLPPVNRHGPCEKTSPRDSIIMVGTYSYKPNVEGASRFLTEVWPEIHRVHPKLKFRIIGGPPPMQFGSIEGVEVLGFVDDLRKEYERAYFAVVPIYAGSGTCIKTLEAASLGRVALCSDFGARGVVADLIDNGVEVAEDSQTMIKRALGLLKDSSRRECEEHVAPSLVKRHYSFDRFAQIVADTMIGGGRVS